MSIVNDWKAINDRMRQIKAEERRRPPCPICKGQGWTKDFLGSRMGRYMTCFACRNPAQHPQPSPEGKQLDRASFRF